jgi:hypothetical protein
MALELDTSSRQSFLEGAWEAFQENPEEVVAWSIQNPEWGTRLWASLAHTGQQMESATSVDMDLAHLDSLPFGLGNLISSLNEKHGVSEDPYAHGDYTWSDYHDLAKYTSSLVGDDVPYDFSGSTFKDVTNFDGDGDWMKIGTTQTPRGGVRDFITENPTIAAMMAIVPQVGLGPVATGAVTNYLKSLTNEENPLEALAEGAASGAISEALGGLFSSVLGGVTGGSGPAGELGEEPTLGGFWDFFNDDEFETPNINLDRPPTATPISMSLQQAPSRPKSREIPLMGMPDIPLLRTNRLPFDMN